MIPCIHEAPRLQALVTSDADVEFTCPARVDRERVQLLGSSQSMGVNVFSKILKSRSGQICALVSSSRVYSRTALTRATSVPRMRPTCTGP
jgi:hypothetical protein